MRSFVQSNLLVAFVMVYHVNVQFELILEDVKMVLGGRGIRYLVLGIARCVSRS